MKRFRLNFICLLLGMCVASGVATLLFMEGWWAQGILVILVGLLCLWGVRMLQKRMIGIMSTFVSGLEMNDSTMMVEAGGDAALRRMSEAMNRISELHRSNLAELETRKLYYDRILKVMTHEMRNGISPLISLAEDMRDNPELYSGGRLVEVSSLFYDQLLGIRQFLDSYYNLTHIPEPKISRVEAKAFFNSLQKMVSHEIRQRGLDEESVSFTMPDGMMLNIDSALFTQVMNNLIRNALDAVAGRVGGCVEVVLTVSDGRPFIQINDNGEGMSESAKENLFQPFFSTKEDGSGVGLYISRQIVRKHGGELTVRSINGKGTFVSVGLMPTQE